jgi:Transposase DNA-binding/Transposase Tn5 dimerisation domain
MSVVLSAQDWAQEQFAGVRLGDRRRTARAVKVASAMASDPSGSIPQQNKKWKQIKGAYRLFDAVQTTFEAMIDPHWQRTRALAGECPVVLLIQDTTELDYTMHPGCEGLGRFGSGPRWESGLGLLLHNVLAIEPKPDGQARVLGLAWNKLWARTQPVRQKRSTAKERREKGGESDRWIEAVDTIGAAPPGTGFVYVGDREADIFNLYSSCRRQNVSFLVRVMQLSRNAVAGHVGGDAKVTAPDRPQNSLKQVSESMPVLGGKSIWIPPRAGRAGRWANCVISGGAVTIYSPWNRSRSGTPLCCWMIRVREVDPPDGIEPLEWILLSDEPVTGLEDALRLTGWYALRWMVEEFHKCLKSGCKVEQRQLEHVDRLDPLIGMLCVLAVRLLQLKNDTRLMPQAPAIQHVPLESVQTMARMLKVPQESITLRQFTHEVAKLGGFIGRKGDGEPGWLTLWRGWHELELITVGRMLVEKARCG